MEIKGKKILLIKLSALGDVVFNIPLANLIKNAGAELHWLVSEKAHAIVNGNPCADKAILAPVEKWKKEKNKIKNFLEYLKIISDIRREKYDIVIDTQLILKSFIWTVFSGSPRRIVAKSAREGAIFGGNEVIEPLFNDYKLHAVYNYFKFAKYLGLDTTKVNVTLPPIEATLGFLTELNTSKKNLMIAPAATRTNKQWSKANWKELISQIDKSKYNIVFLGTNKDTEFISDISRGNFLNLAGKTTLEDLIGVLKMADILISLDSGVTQLAWATGKPAIISIFCCTPKESYAPLGFRHIALSGGLKCQPCHRKKCPLKTNKCTEYPLPDEVLDVLIEIERNLVHA